MAAKPTTDPARLEERLKVKLAASERRLAARRAAMVATMARQKAADDDTAARRDARTLAVFDDMDAELAELAKLKGDAAPAPVAPGPPDGPAPATPPAPDAGPTPTAPEEPPAVPTPARPPADDDIPGGPIGSGGRTVRDRGRRFTSTADFSKYPAKTDLVDAVFATGKEMAHAGRVPDDFRLINPTYEDIEPGEREEGHGSHLGYVDAGHEPKTVGFVLWNPAYRRCKATTVLEVKGLDGAVLGRGRILPGCDLKQGIRVRHGKKVRVEGWRGLPLATFRGEDHEIEDCPDTQAVFYAGPLPPDYPRWGPMHEANKGQAWQATRRCKAKGVASVVNGLLAGAMRFKAEGNVIDPGVASVRNVPGNETGTRREAW